MADAVAIVISGLTLGSLYALIAAGLSLMWTTLGVYNFGHGVLLTLGAYVAWTFVQHLGLPLGIATVLALLALALFAIVYEIALIRPFLRRDDGPMLVMVATLAITALLESAVQLIWGTQILQLPTFTSAKISIDGSAIGGNQLVAIIVAPILIGSVWAMLKKTSIGVSVRALEQNRDHARLVGIRPALVYVFVVVCACVLAAVAGILLSGINFMSPTMGDDPLLKAFVVIAFGGAAGMAGTLAGAYAIGLLEALTTYFFGLEWSPVLVFGILIIVMLIRPEGLIARRSS